MALALTFAVFSVSGQYREQHREQHGERHCAMPAGECAQELPRPVISTYNLEIGGMRALSTYLSPLYYDGVDFALSGSWTKAFNYSPERMLMRFEANVEVMNLYNPTHTARTLGAFANFNWGLAARWRFAEYWQASVGGMLDLYGGALYLTRNSNNPVSAIASTSLDLSASLSYRFDIGRLPVVVSDEVRIPTISGFFSPGYGEPYYEIYLGNHSRLAHFGWWGNAFGIDNLLSFKLDFGRTAMQIGYRLNLRTFWANNLNTQLLRNAFVIGVIPNGLGLKKKKQANLPF